MQFSVLGPLEVRADGRAVALGGVKARALLAMLVLHANEPVSAERLALAVWGEDAPAAAVKTVQVYVSRLRKALGDPDVLTTTPAGYSLRLGPGELDVERFEQLVAEGRRALAGGAPDEAAGVLRQALAVWRGPALADLAALPFAAAEIDRLEEQRLTALELRLDADLAAGRHAELIAELGQLTRTHPWRERLHALHMLALYRSGRQADALEAYRSARTALVEELGIEPGAELAQLHQAILAHDPMLDPPRRAPDDTPPATVMQPRRGHGGPGAAACWSAQPLSSLWRRRPSASSRAPARPTP
jgi:DNA-binding SARP family transcriptional activator